MNDIGLEGASGDVEGTGVDTEGASVDTVDGAGVDAVEA